MARYYNTNVAEIPHEQRGRVLKWLREHKGLTQEQLGELVGSSGATVSQYERGVRNMSTDRFLLIMETLGAKVVIQTPWPISEMEPANSAG